MINEIWKPVLGYEGLYEVSNYGRVKSVGRVFSVESETQCTNYFTNRIWKEKFRKLTIDRYGYLFVILHKTGKRKKHLVSRLVWSAFNGPIPAGMQINHINEDKTDNRLENLNLMTPKENVNWGTRSKRVGDSLLNRSDSSKTVLQFTLDGKFVKEWPSLGEIKRKLGLEKSNVSLCCLGKYSTAYGFKWAYKE